MKNKRVLITGGAGFIGANIARHYLEKGYEVTIYDNLFRKNVETNVRWLKRQFRKNLLVTIADVRNFTKLKNAVKGKDVIFHCAGQTAVTTSIEDPRQDYEMNAQGTFNVLESMRQLHYKGMMFYCSTNKVYGEMSRVRTTSRGKRYVSIESPSIDESERISFYSPYGCSKGSGDQYTLDYARIYGLKTVVFRQSCIYGAHQFGVEDQGWVAHFAASAILDKTLKIYGDGKQVRDILYIDDLVRAFDKAYRNSSTTAGQVYNIGGGIDNTVSLIELTEILEKITGRKMKMKFAKERKGDQKYYVSNIDKAYRDFHWKPKISVERGIHMLYEWLEESLT